MFNFSWSTPKTNHNDILNEQVSKIRIRVRELDRKIFTTNLHKDASEARVRAHATSGNKAQMKVAGEEYFAHDKQMRSYQQMKKNLTDLQMRIEQMKNQIVTTDIMEGLTKALEDVNSVVDIDRVNDIKVALETETMKNEALAETMDEMFEGDGEDSGDLEERIYNTFGDELREGRDSRDVRLENRLEKLTKTLE